MFSNNKKVQELVDELRHLKQHLHLQEKRHDLFWDDGCYKDSYYSATTKADREIEKLKAVVAELVDYVYAEKK